jgi:hypothetical protein
MRAIVITVGRQPECEIQKTRQYGYHEPSQGFLIPRGELQILHLKFAYTGLVFQFFQHRLTS